MPTTAQNAAAIKADRARALAQRKPAAVAGIKADTARALSQKKAPVKKAAAKKAPVAAVPRTTAAPASAAVPAVPAPATGGSDLARQTYGYMAWALDDAELGPLLTKAATEGWDENRLRGALYATNWFKQHGTAKVAAQLKEQADAFLVPMDEASRKAWAMKVTTGQVQPTEYLDFLRTQAKSMFGSNAALMQAIDRGVTVTEWASPYRAMAANTLELAPEAIDLSEARWRRALDGGKDEKGQPTTMSLSDWERTLKQDASYGWDRTKQARQQAAQFATSLSQMFGRIG